MTSKEILRTDANAMASVAQSFPPTHDVVTSFELAELWKVTQRWVMDKARLVKDPLPCYKLDRRTVRFSRAEAEKWFRQHSSRRVLNR